MNKRIWQKFFETLNLNKIYDFLKKQKTVQNIFDHPLLPLHMTLFISSLSEKSQLKFFDQMLASGGLRKINKDFRYQGEVLSAFLGPIIRYLKVANVW